MRMPLRLLALGVLALWSAAPAMAGPKGTKAPGEATCGDYGTSVHFEESPKDAAKRAQKEEKLVVVLHVSGNFEDPEFTWNNAEALRVGALADPKVGKYFEENFVCAYQRVGTFRIVGKGNKQGGNVATYFCAPDGRVLHAIAGPVNADTLLRESKWVVATAEKGIAASKGDGGKFKAFMRQAHAEKVRSEEGLAVEPVTFDPPEPQGADDALTYRDPTGRPLAPVLPPPPINGPDVKFLQRQESNAKAAAGGTPGFAMVEGKGGRGWAISNQGRVHHLMAAHALVSLDRVYGSVFEGILGERVSTRPVEIVNPFPGQVRNGAKGGLAK